MAFSIDDQRLHDPRIRALRRLEIHDHAVALDVLAGILCAERRTDGRVQRGAAHGLLRDTRKAAKAAAALVSVGLWREHPEDDEYELVGFLKRDGGLNESRDEMVERRRRQAEKSARHYHRSREGRVGDSTSDRDSDRSDSTSDDGSCVRSSDDTPSTQYPVPSSSLRSEEGERAPETPATNRRTKPRARELKPAEQAIAEAFAVVAARAGIPTAKPPWSSALAQHAAQVEQVAQRHGLEPRELAFRVVDRFFADEWAREHGPTWRMFVADSQFQKHLAAVVVGLGSTHKRDALAELEARHKQLQRELSCTPDEDFDEVNRLQRELTRVWNEIRRRKDAA